MNYVSAIIFLALFCCLGFACEDNNFDFLTEEELSEEPTIVDVVPESYVEFRSPEGKSAGQIGRGLITDDGLIALGTSEEEFLTCQRDGSIRLANDKEGLFLAFNTSPNLELLRAWGNGVEGIEEEEVFSVRGCDGGTPPVLRITEQTQEAVAGTLTAELYKPKPDSTIASELCDNYVSLGVYEIAFRVDLVSCP
ncbi:MAG: hypothetical protein AAFN92_13830 [Bacteroidota bacterium]